MGNYVIGAGNYVIASPSELGNYLSADTRIIRKQDDEPPADLLGTVLGMQPILHMLTQPALEG
jgi:hypothetical protein